MSDKKPLFKLRPDVLQNLGAGGTINLGSWGPTGPARVELSRSNPTVEGEEYAQYETFLVRVKPNPSVVSQAAKLKKLRESSKKKEGAPKTAAKKETTDEKPPEPAEDVEQEEEADEPKEEIKSVPSLEEESEEEEEPIVEDKVEYTEDPEPEEAEELELSEEKDVPTASDIKGMNRGELEKKAKYLGVWDDIEGTGRDGYRKSEDIEAFLVPFVEDYHSGDEEE